jgi:3-dehydroquinate synthase
LIKVNLPQNSYEVRIGSGLLNEAGTVLKDSGFKGRAIIISNPLVGDLYSDALKGNLENSGFKVVVLEVPDGEEYKSLDQASKLYDQLSDFQAERTTPILALGGGVIGDLAGFVAATYLRGVALIQIPTTLLAQVDSSIGGKVAVNHGQLKNTIGSFFQPRLVLSDISTLKTLPEKEKINGLAEIIKYGIIRDNKLFDLVESNMPRLLSFDRKLLEEVIFLCADIKVKIVEKDERDLGLRNILNYGHTLGHALETVSDFGLRHGSGVAVGMVAAAEISRRMGFLSTQETERIKSVIFSAGLPIKICGGDPKKIIQTMQHDKKKVGGKIRFILSKTIGEVFICDEVSTTLLKQVLEDLYEEAPNLCHNRGL